MKKVFLFAVICLQFMSTKTFAEAPVKYIKASDKIVINICLTMQTRGFAKDAENCANAIKAINGLEPQYDSQALNICSGAAARGFAQTAIDCLLTLKNKSFDQTTMSMATVRATRGFTASALELLNKYGVPLKNTTNSNVKTKPIANEKVTADNTKQIDSNTSYSFMSKSKGVSAFD